jgi:UDPglucose 6-dehydrogenase
MWGWYPAPALRISDALVIVTEWAQFRALDLERLKREMAHPVIVDLRNIYRPDDMASLGFICESVGRRRTSQINIVKPSRSPVAPRPKTKIR